MWVQRIINERPHERDYLEEYCQWLLSVGNGTAQTYIDQNIIKLDNDIMCDTPKDVLDTIYDNIHMSNNNSDYFQKRAILAATNDSVHKANTDLLQKIDGHSMTFVSLDTVVDKDQAVSFPTEFLNNIEFSGLPQHIIQLKVGAPIMLMRNLDVKNGHCNGTRYVVYHMSRFIITAKCLDSDNIVLIPKIPSYTKDSQFPFIMKRLQFPVKLAFAMTFNKSQGQSLEKCGILLPTSVWTHGQLYVGLSRCSDKRCLRVYSNQEEFQNLQLPSGYYTRNVVYTEMFHPFDIT
jgi:ATP-dependent DNA helicase PIF1